MGLPLDQPGYEHLLDAVGSGTTSSGSMVDGGFGPRAPWSERPWASAPERQLSEALKIASVPAEEIRKIQANLPINPYGEGVAYDREPLSIEDALDVNRWAPSVRSWTSGASRPRRRSEVEQQMWEGTHRGSMMSVNPMN